MKGIVAAHERPLPWTDAVGQLEAFSSASIMAMTELRAFWRQGYLYEENTRTPAARVAVGARVRTR
jgi:hypothetical protein